MIEIKSTLVITLLIFLLGTLSIQTSSMEPQTKLNTIDQRFLATKQEIKQFITALNDLRSKSGSDDKHYLKLIKIDSSEEVFSAYMCWTLNCTSKDEYLLERDFKLFYSDVNNDGQQDFTLVIMDQGGEQDVIEGAYNVKNQTLYELPYQEMMINRIGQPQQEVWPSFIGSPFISEENGQVFLNFVNAPIYKNSNGEQIFSPQSFPASRVETNYYTYLWFNNSLELINVRTEVRYLDSSGP